MQGVGYAIGAVLAASFVTWGVNSCVKDPPQPVADRFTTIVMESYSCGGDGKQTCYAPATHYKLVSERGAVCDVTMYQYAAARKGDEHKCIQLFGWHGGRKEDGRW